MINCGEGSRVATVTVGDEFHKERTLASGDPLFRKLDTLVDSNDIHSIDLAKFVSSDT